jgi:hypothetical protein
MISILESNSLVILFANSLKNKLHSIIFLCKDSILKEGVKENQTARRLQLKNKWASSSTWPQLA